MKRFLWFVIALVAVVGIGVSGTAQANFSSVSQQSPYVATYTVDIPWTLNGNNVTNVVIFEAGSGQVSVDPLNTLPVGDVSVLSMTTSFSPTSALILGTELANDPNYGTGKNHLVMFMNEAFAANYEGHTFSSTFTGYHEQDFINALILAETNNDLGTLEGYFTGPFAQATFNPDGGSFWIMESSDGTHVVPEPSTFLLLGAGLAGVGLLRRRFKK